MLGSFKETKSMDKANLRSLMERFMKETLLMISSKIMEFISSATVESSKDNGRLERSKVEES